MVTTTAPSWLRGGVSNTYFEPTAGVRFEAHAPHDAPEIWRDYLEGLIASYRAHGVENALDLDAIWLGTASPIVIVAIDENERVVGGVRAHGPLTTAYEAHAVGEFVSNPESQRKVIEALEERLLFGVIEFKGGWVADDFPRRRDVSNAIARCYIHLIDMLGVQYGFCTSAIHAATRWVTSGATPLADLEPVPYPDDRYLTTMLFWDRQTVAQDASPEQWALIRREAASLRGMQLIGPGSGGSHAVANLPSARTAQSPGRPNAAMVDRNMNISADRLGAGGVLNRSA